MTSRSIDDIRFDLYRNGDEPIGSPRNARAEQLVAEAEGTGDRPLLVEALIGLTIAYSHSAECDKMFVPFSRLLRMWDENPADFDEDDAHQLFWMFKWVSGDAMAQPQIPLASIEEWLVEMRRRYRIAGHSERAVHARDFEVARYLGDVERAERALSALLAADRDEMADCHACELHEQGQWQVERGDDAAALEVWRPVLEGRESCLHEPHATLARSLLPLVRLGRLDAARSHHLRGYRMARSVEALGSSVAAHVEFCALTGNEPRGLEILAEQTPRWELRGDALPYMEWMACAALLSRRVVDLGHGDRPVPGPPGRQWTAAALLEHATDEALAMAVRFDERNGSTRVSDLLRLQMGAEPLLDSLPLGLRSAPLGQAASAVGAARGTGARVPAVPGTGTEAGARQSAPAPRSASAGVPRASDDPRELLVRARQLSDTLHPSAGAAWQRAARAVEGGGGALDDGDRADLLDATALGLRGPGQRAADLLAEAAEAHERAGQPGKALVSRGRVTLAALRSGRAESALEEIEELCARAEALHADGRASTRQVATVLVFRCRVRAALLGAAADPHAEAARLKAELDDLLAFARPHHDEPGVLSRVADATELLGLLAAMDDPAAAVPLFTAAVSHHHASGRPWLAVSAEIQLAQSLLAQGEKDRATAVVRAVLDDPDRVALLDPVSRARLCFALAQAVSGQEGHEAEEAALLVDTAHYADLSGELPALALRARHHLGGLYCDRGRLEEAASVLESVLPDLAQTLGESDMVQARVWLAHCYTGTQEHRLAAEQYALAATTAQHWDDQRHHAVLTHQAGQALSAAGMNEEAVRAYEQAVALWRGIGDVGATVRALRAQAWEALGARGQSTAEALMREALAEAEKGLRDTELPEERAALGIDVGETHQQLAQLHLEGTDGPPDRQHDTDEQYAINVAAFEAALVCAGRAVGAFRACGQHGQQAMLSAELQAARLELALERPRDAALRTRRLRAELERLPDPDGTLADLADECDAVLMMAERNLPGR